jgi:glycerol-3-phosphate acyltransferase PlsY
MPQAVVLAYLIGSVPFALLLTRWSGVEDLRRVGSGNIGATNVLRASGFRVALAVVVLDVAKGAASVQLAAWLSDSRVAPAAAGLSAIVGHIYPVWLRFRGGKGVATACGVFAVLAPRAVPPALVVFTAVTWVTRYVSLGSVLGSLTVPLVAEATGSPAAVVGAAASAAALIVFRHRANLARLCAGTERRFGRPEAGAPEHRRHDDQSRPHG